ncbi:MAG: glycosyltransferase family 2 protein [Clostridia bacterium]|nr:glycosyltransferase family 2 protein [Clostridia bacterium]
MFNNEISSVDKAAPLVSLIIPIYNVEKYLSRCLDSVIGQTYKNIEILLINDGSTDTSAEIAEDYMHLDDRITVYHKENGGLSSARNYGLAYAKGAYICFVDSDDWIALDTIEYSVNLILNYNADIVQFGVYKTNGKKNIKERKEKRIILRGKEIIHFLMVKSTIDDSYYAAWRCLYTKEVLKDLLFPIGKINEDIVWKYKVFSNADLIVDTSKVKYFYYSNNGSITKNGLKKRDFDLYAAAEGIKELTQSEEYGKIKELGEVKYARTSLSLLCKIAFYGISDTSINKKDVVSKLKKDLKKDLRLLLHSPMKKSRKILALMFSISYNMTECCIRIAKKCIGS